MGAGLRINSQIPATPRSTLFGRDGYDQPLPLHSIAEDGDVEILQDIKIYDLEKQAWRALPLHLHTAQPQPAARYGHIAAPLDGQRLVSSVCFKILGSLT